jgi:phosphatidate cytidylyltransferase
VRDTWLATQESEGSLKGLGLRTVSGAVLLAVVLAAIWVQGLLLMAAVALAAGLAAHEFYSVVRRAGYMPWYPAGLALALLLALRGYLGGDLLAGRAFVGPSPAAEVMVMVLVLFLALARQGFGWGISRPQRTAEATATGPLPGRSPYLAWADLGLTLGGALYTGALLGYAPLLAAVSETPNRGGGTAWLLMVLLGTAACDTGAYLVGSAIGRHKLIPHISPGKTWEGLAGAVVGAVVAAVALSGLLKIGLVESVALGLLICVAAVSGDLCESLLKRAAGVKDSGHIIPGHGGVLDRIDSILFVTLAVYWFVGITG